MLRHLSLLFTFEPPHSPRLKGTIARHCRLSVEMLPENEPSDRHRFIPGLFQQCPTKYLLHKQALLRSISYRATLYPGSVVESPAACRADPCPDLSWRTNPGVARAVPKSPRSQPSHQGTIVTRGMQLGHFYLSSKLKWIAKP